MSYLCKALFLIVQEEVFVTDEAFQSLVIMPKSQLDFQNKLRRDKHKRASMKIASTVCAGPECMRAGHDSRLHADGAGLVPRGCAGAHWLHHRPRLQVRT